MLTPPNCTWPPDGFGVVEDVDVVETVASVDCVSVVVGVGVGVGERVGAAVLVVALAVRSLAVRCEHRHRAHLSSGRLTT